MGKYKKGDRVRLSEHPYVGIEGEGTYVKKRKDFGSAKHLVEVTDSTHGDKYMLSFRKHQLSPLPANDDAPATQEREFKVGDRVKCSDPNTPDDGVVAFVDEDILVEFKGWGRGHTGASSGQIFEESDYYWCAPDDLTPAPEWQPKVGDRVRHKGSGLPADVRRSEGETPVLIEFDEPQYNLGTHNAYAQWTAVLARKGCALFVSHDEIEPLPVAAEAQGAGLRVEAGKTYPDTNGKSVGPMIAHNRGFIEVPGDGRMWNQDGSAVNGHPALVLPAPLTIEAGKFYKTRDGRKVGPMEPFAHGNCRFHAPDDVKPFSGGLWERDGSPAYAHMETKDSPHLVAEWVEPEPKIGSDAKIFIGGEPLGEIKSFTLSLEPTPKFKVGDRVRIARNSRGNHWLNKEIGKEITINAEDGDGSVEGWAGSGSIHWWPAIDLDLVSATPAIGSTVTLATPGVITGHNGPNVSVALPQGSYDLPLAALVSA